MQEKQPPPAGSRPRRWLPLASVVLCLAVVVVGGRVAASALTVPGPPVQVASGISVRPLSGWRVVRQGTGVLLTRGSGSLSVHPPATSTRRPWLASTSTRCYARTPRG